MSKAFDTIDHVILLNKLKFYGFDEKSVKLVHSYLSDRFQSVFYNGCFSQYLEVITGVPQGSILGPTMFIVYINDLPSALNNVCVSSFMYADDLAIQISCSNINLVNQIMSHFNSVAEDWTAANGLCLNKDKTQCIKFSLSNSIDVNDVKFLGVLLQSNIKWEAHIVNVCNKISKGTFMIRRLKQYVTLDVLLSVYYAYIQSHLSYGIIVWGCDSNIKKLLILQKRVLRIMCNASCRTHCKPLFKDLGILTVTSLYILQLLLYVRINLNVLPTNSSIHDHDTRQRNLLRIRQCNYQATIKSTYEMGIKIYNMLPREIKCLDDNKFKIKLKSLLIELSIYDVKEFILYCTNC
uniref:Reverse transcriptase domain-containing protein n=1 Tax=Homalodisca liturata TaxID=320908 RepID=A0A1B6JF12_9HEMI